MPKFHISERQVVLVSATVEAETEEEAKNIFLDGDPPGIETNVLDSHDLAVELVPSLDRTLRLAYTIVVTVPLDTTESKITNALNNALRAGKPFTPDCGDWDVSPLLIAAVEEMNEEIG